MTVSGISVYLTSFHALVVQGAPDLPQTPLNKNIWVYIPTDIVAWYFLSEVLRCRF